MFVLAATLGQRQYIFYRCTSGLSNRFAQVQQAMRAVVFRVSRLMRGHVAPQSEFCSGTVEEKGQVSLKTYNCIIGDLLIAGADPNHSLGVDGYSPWALAITFTEAMPINAKAIDWYYMLSRFLTSGADPNESIRIQKKQLVLCQTVLSMLTTKISAYWARQNKREQLPNDEVIQSMTHLTTMLIQRESKKTGNEVSPQSGKLKET